MPCDSLAGCYANAWPNVARIRILYKPDKRVYGISYEQLVAVFDNYPLAKTVIDLLKEFKALLKKKKPDLLAAWMRKVEAIGIPEFETFINGLRLDIDAVKNAFVSDFSNGLIEGTINKIKVIKRIMYGRCSFNLLKNKCMNPEY